MRLTNFTFVQLFFLLLLFSCGKKDGKSSKGLLPDAKGAPGEIILVIDSTTYEGKVGEQIRKIFKGDIQWLSRPQSQFTVRVVQPDKLNSVLRGSKNLVYVTVLNDKNRGNRILRSNFTSESMSRIKKDSSLFMFTKQDEFARNQQVMHLFGLTDDILAKNLSENSDKIRDYFNKVELDRTQKNLFNAQEEKGIEKAIQDGLGCNIRIPYGYEVAIQKDSFIWVRFLDPEVDRSITIAFVDYTSQDQFKKENLIQLRDSIAHRYIYGDPENPASYMTTETENFPVFRSEINFKGNYAVQLRGLWKTNNLSMGGPFISYALVDEQRRRLYYIEGFLYSPTRKQREYVRELDAILRTFNIKGKNS